MNYKELIGRLKYYGTTYAIGDNLGREIDGTDQVMDDAANAIETLLAELDAAMKLLRTGKSKCDCCMHNESSIHEYPCRDCKDCGGMSDYWQWRGVRKQE